MIKIKSVSLLNLRSRTREKKRELEKSIGFTCSVCGRRRRLGKNEGVMTKIEYEVDGEVKEDVLCGSCTDVWVDMFRYGPRVARELYRWRRKSRVTRAYLIEENLFCYSCLHATDSHVFVKFDDLTQYEVKLKTMRVCANCAINYLLLLKNSKDIEGRKIPVEVTK